MKQCILPNLIYQKNNFMAKEIWKDILGYKGSYQVSNIGRVKSLGRLDSLNRFRKGKILKYGIHKDYKFVILCKKGVTKNRNIHQLVAESFLNHKVDGLNLVVNHIDLDTLNNNASNLEIVTQRENANRKHLKSTSKFTGVHFVSDKNKWRSKIVKNGKQKHLGYFNNEFIASIAYQLELVKL